jgi:hypothetical protein
MAADPVLSAPQLAEQLRERGFMVSVRTAQRIRSKALESAASAELAKQAGVVVVGAHWHGARARG